MTGIRVPVFAQTSIRLVDGESGEPVSFAHVCFESLDKAIIQDRVADDSGMVIYTGNRAFQLAATAVGYVTLIDTLPAAGVFTLYMQPTSFEMDEVVITAQYSPRRVDQSIYNVSVIDNRKIREKGATTLSELLNNELSVRISNDASLGSSMSIQGLSGEHVKILIDGVPVIGRLYGNIDLSQINMQNVDHIEMVEGPVSVIYGSNALAGAVNIITRENTRSKLMAWQDSYLESVGVYNFDLGTAGNFGKHSFSLSGARNFFGGYSEVDTSRSKRWKPKLQYNLDGYYMFRTAHLKLKLDMNLFDETIQNKGNLLRDYYFEKAFDTYNYTRRWSQRLQGDYDLAEGRKINAIVANSRYRRIRNTFLKDLTTLSEILSGDSTQHDTTGFGAWLFRGTYTEEKPSGKFGYQAGTDINIESGEGERIGGGRETIGDYAFFASFRYEPFSTLTFQPGLRYGYNSRYRSPLVPSFNIRWGDKPGNNILRASYARGFRAPSLKELYLYFVDINHNLRGNPDLKAEYSHNVNLTWDHTIDRRYNKYGFRAGIFFSGIHDKIDLLPDNQNQSDSVYTYINIDRFRSFGTNLKLRYSLHPRFTLETGISEIGRQYITERGGGNRSDIYYSTDITSTASYYWLSRRIRFLASYKYNGRHPELQPVEDGEIAVFMLKPYHIMDVTATKPFWQDRIMLGLGAKNLFDYNSVKVGGSSASGGIHVSEGGSDRLVGWGRSYFISLSINFSKF